MAFLQVLGVKTTTTVIAWLGVRRKDLVGARLLMCGIRALL